MNILIFILQTAVVIGAVFWALRMGKEALVSLSVLLCVLANFFVLKQISLLGWNVTCSDAFAIGNIFGLNLLQQAHGKEAAQRTIWISFFGMLVFTLLSQIHLFFIPNSFDTSQEHYASLLGYAPRLLGASILTFFVVQQIDVRLYARLSSPSWKNRMVVTLLISQALDTILFSFLGLYGVVQEIGSVIVVSYLVKCAVILLTSFSTRVVKYEV
jgi:queuosine precursor transporter